MIENNLLKHNVKDKKILSIDCETESLNLKFARPWDISFITYQGYHKIEEKQFYVKWDSMNIPAVLAEKIHFNQELVTKEGLETNVAMDIVNKYLNDKSYDIITGNNLLNYDSMVFYNACKLCDIKLGYEWLNRVYDCNSLFKGYKRGISPDHNNLLAWQLSQNNFVQKGLKSNVKYICEEFNIPFNEEELHGSIADARLSIQILFDLIKKIDI